MAVRAARNFLVVPVGIVWPQPLVWGQPRRAEAPRPAASPHPRAQPAQVRSPQAELRAAGAVAVLLAPRSGFPSSHLCGKLASGGPGCCPVTHLLLLIPKFRAFSQPWCRPCSPVEPAPLTGLETLPGLPPLRVSM